MTDVAAHAREILETTSYVVLGTADAAGEPWVTPVWFAPDGLHRLYWLSWPGSHHSSLIEQRPTVALTVFDSGAAPHQGAAVYATAYARRCRDDELDEGLEVVNHRSTSQGIGAFTREGVTAAARLRVYVATVTGLWVLDQDAAVDRRVPVPIGGVVGDP